MSGVYGILEIEQTLDPRALLGKMASTLSHMPWYVTDVWTAPEASVGLGRVGIGILNKEPQPVVSTDGSLVLFMSGEFYNAGLLRQELGAAPGQPDAELALRAFQAYGTTFAARLDGAFFIAIYDCTQQRLLLTNDRFGLYPHYYSWRAGKLAFAPEVKGVLCAPFVPRQLNVAAVAEYFRFQQLLGDKTFHEDVHLFPYGSVALFDLRENTWSIQRYWDWDQIPYRPEVSFDEAVTEVGRLLRGAVEHMTEDDLRPGVFLSGGLDSRTLLGFVSPRQPPPVSAAFGVRNSRDVYYAEQVARAVGSRHYWFDLPDGRWVLDYVDLHLKLTEGFHNWIHMHGMTMLSPLREVMDYNLTGWDGGTVMGHPDHINTVYNQPVSEQTVLAETYKRFNESYTWPGMTEAEEYLVYSDAFRKQARGLAFDSMQKEFAPFWNFRQEYAAEYFYIVNHCWRLTGHMVTTTRSHLEVRSPFWDYQLIDFMYSLRPEVRRDQLMYRHIITQQLPHLATIPYDKQEFLPTVRRMHHDLHALSVRARRRLGLFPVRPTLYADYESYLRHELRDWAEGILFDRRTEERGILNMPFVRSLMAQHVSGNTLWTIGKVAPLITFELVMRAWFD